MDPSVAWRESQCISNGWRARAVYARNLLGWLSSGGFKPAGYTAADHNEVLRVASFGNPAKDSE